MVLESSATLQCCVCAEPSHSSCVGLFHDKPMPYIWLCSYCRNEQREKQAGQKRKYRGLYQVIGQFSSENLHGDSPSKLRKNNFPQHVKTLVDSETTVFTLFDLLSMEIQCYILSFLKQRELTQLAAVNKYFNGLIRDAQFWKELTVHNSQGKICHSLCKNYGQSLVVLSLFCCFDHVHDDTMGIIASFCPLLRNLNLQFCVKVTDDGIKKLCDGDCKDHLQELKLSFLFSLSEKSLEYVSSLPNLNHLDIMMYGGTSITSQFEIWASKFPSLKSVKIWDSDQEFGDNFGRILCLTVKEGEVLPSDGVDPITFKEKYEQEGKANAKVERALELLQAANAKHADESDIEAALVLYEESISEYPTADGYTYLGWMHSLLGNSATAMDNCYKAMQVDPEFGNPYNDLGCAFLELELEDVAIRLFEKAKTARRYECWHFPYQNLGNTYRTKHKTTKALIEAVC